MIGAPSPVERKVMRCIAMISLRFFRLMCVPIGLEQRCNEQPFSAEGALLPGMIPLDETPSPFVMG